jgi:hypothetical protein
MVIISAYYQRQTNEGKPFLVLELQGGLEIVKSKLTGKSYATNKRCTLPCTFDETVAKGLIGTHIQGNIEKVECEPYDYKLPNSDEVVTLDYSYSYVEPQSERAHITSPKVVEVI